MPPIHPARTKRPRQPNWSVTIDSRRHEVTKGSGQYAPKDAVVSDEKIVDLTLRSDEGAVYVARLSMAQRCNWYSLSQRGMAKSYKEMSKKPRAFAYVSDDVEFLFVEPMKGVADFPHLDLRGYGRKEDGTFEQMRDEPSMHTHRGDFPEVDAEFDRYNGQVIATERMFLKWLMPIVDAELSKARFDFSNYAGCGMCPCSPGFVVSNVRRHDRVDYQLSVMSNDERVVRDEQIAKAQKERKEKARKEKLAKAEKLRAEAQALEQELTNA